MNYAALCGTGIHNLPNGLHNCNKQNVPSILSVVMKWFKAKWKELKATKIDNNKVTKKIIVNVSKI